MPLINIEISLILTWSKSCFLVAVTAANQEPTFMITGIKLFVLVVTLSTQGNVKLLRQLESGFKSTINMNKNQQKADIWIFLIHSSFQGVNNFFVLSFEYRNRERYQQYFLPTVDKKDYNVTLNGRNFFDQPVNMISEQMIKFKKLLLLKVMIIHIVIY